MDKAKKRQGFQCKQFFVAHDQCAMKVGTDSLILGSWCDITDSKQVLDIGSGSGILSLMLAQKSDTTTQVTGIDIDGLAVNQATENAKQCLWSDRLSFIHCDALSFKTSSRFDCIVSNPPYFAQTESASIQMTSSRRQARQASSLSFEQLIDSVDSLLAETGRFYVIIPYDESERMERLANDKGLFCIDKLSVRSHATKPFIRQCLCFGYDEVIDKAGTTMTIYDNEGNYTLDYQTLCRAFYLTF